MTAETAVQGSDAAPQQEQGIPLAIGKILQRAATIAAGQQPAPQAAPVAPQAPRAPVAQPPVASQPPEPDASNMIEFFEREPAIEAGLDTPPPSAPQMPEPPPAPEPEIPDPPEIKTDPRAAKAWELGKKERKELKAKYEAAQQQAKELMAQLSEEKSGKSEREVELTKRLAELENEVGRYSLRATDDFKNKYVKPVEAQYRKAVSALVRANVPADEAQNVVAKLIKSQSAEEVETALSELPRFVQGVVSAAVFEAQELERQGLEAEQQWKQTRAALGSEASQIEEAKFKKALVNDTVEAAQQLADKYGSWAFKADVADPKQLEWREKAVLTAQHILERGSDRDLARAILEGVAAPSYRKWGEAWKAKATALQAELEAREASKPRLGAGGQIAPPAAKPVTPPKALTIQEGIRMASEMSGFKIPGR